MRTYPLRKARAEFSKLVDRALAGEPQRVTRYGKEVVVIVAEAEWAKRSRSAASLGELLARFATERGFSEEHFERPWTGAPRPLGAHLAGCG